MDTIRIIKKICMLGDPAVGKTSLVQRYVLDEFSERYATTTGTRIMKKDVTLQLEGRILEITLMIHDIVGQKGYEELHRMYFQGTEGALVVTDLTRSDTLDNVDGWVSLLFDVTGEIPMILVANKSDLADERQCNQEELRRTADMYNADWTITSAKTSENVDRAFETLCRRMGLAMEF
ncbi:MAG: GTP-binding protein [Thermoplasmata archaeon]|nr:GTP-binding protein [Thermoplasmata archaeon]